MKKAVSLMILLGMVIIALGVLYFLNDIDAVISNTVFFEIITTITAVFGVFGFIWQMSESKELEQSQFIIDLNKLYFTNKNFEKVMSAVINNTLEFSSGNIQTEIIECMNYFEPFYIILKNNAVDMNAIDELFAGRFFTIINNKYIQDTIITPKKDFYHNIVCLHHLWRAYRLRKGKSIPYESSDLSLLSWYNEIFDEKSNFTMPDSASLQEFTIEIREATSRDFNEITSLYEQLLGKSATDESISMRLDEIREEKNNYIFVTLLDEKIVGTVQCTICPSVAFCGKPHMVLDYFIVDKQYRHMGIGTHLVHYIKSVAKQNNVSDIYLVSSKHLKKSHKFYRKIGFNNPVKGFRMLIR